MNEILNTAITALVLLAGLAALIRYAAHDVFAGPFPSPRADDLDLDLRRAVTRLHRQGLSRP